MREIRQSGSEGGGGETNRLSLPLFRLFTVFKALVAAPRSAATFSVHF
jgi:hypothetical protein